MSNSRKRLAILAASGMLVVGAGWGYAWWNEHWTEFPIQLPERTRHPAPPSPPGTRSLSERITVADIVPTESGPGLVVCDPRMTAAPKDVTEFGLGCAYWLHFHVAGQVEFGKTPRHWTIGRAQTEMGKNLLDLTATEAVRFGKLTGATHVVLGELTSTAGSRRLTYRLHSTVDGRPVGEPHTLTGTEAEITRQLPLLARALAADAGATNPFLPERTGETAADLRWLGRTPFPIGRILTVGERRKLEQMRGRSTLALLFLALASYEGLEVPDNQNHVIQVSIDLASRAPRNAIAVAEAAITLDEKNISPSLSNSQRGSTDSHENYLLHTATAYIRHHANDLAGARAAAASAARAAPNNPDAWFSLAAVIGSEGVQIRKGRFIGDMTPAEAAASAEITTRTAAFWRRVIELDPAHALGLRAVAYSSAYTGDLRKMEATLQAMRRIPYARLTAYNAAFELYGPKFYSDQSALSRYANQLAAERWANSEERVAAARALHEAGFQSLAIGVLRRTEDRLAFQALMLDTHIPASSAVVPPGKPTGGAPSGLGAPSSAPYKELGHHSGDVLSLAWSADGKLVASAGQDNTVRVHPVEGGVAHVLHGHTAIIRDVVWNPHEPLLASGGDDGTLRIWDGRKGAELYTYKVDGGLVSQVAWSPSGRTLAVVGRTSTSLLDAASGAVRKRISGPGGPATSLQFNRESSTLFTNRWEHFSQPAQMLQIWDLKAGKPRYVGAPTGNTRAVAWTLDGGKVAAGTIDQKLWIWSVPSGELLRTLKPSQGLRVLAWHPEGKVLASAGDDRRITLWNAVSGKPIHILRGHLHPIGSLAWAPTGKRLVSSSGDGKVLLWNLDKILAGGGE